MVIKLTQHAIVTKRQVYLGDILITQESGYNGRKPIPEKYLQHALGLIKLGVCEEVKKSTNKVAGASLKGKKKGAK